LNHIKKMPEKFSSLLLKKIKRIIDKEKLFHKGDRVLVCVSAGLDSIVLLEVLCRIKKEYNLHLFVSHYDHKIRKDSSKDALFVYEICKKKKIPLFYTASSVPLYAKKEKLSLEMAGRELRYQLWYNLSKKYDFHKIALAHHLDDLVEEVLLRLIKGTGKRGLAGIPIIREDLIVRPLLHISKEEIKKFALAEGLTWREDPSNQDLRILRNKIRHVLIPYLEKNFNPKIKENLKRTAFLISEEEEFIERIAREHYQSLKKIWEEDLILNVQELKKLAPALRRRIYFLAFKEAGIPLFRITSRNLFQLENLILKQAKGPVYLPGNYLVYRGPGYLRITRKVFTTPYYEIVVSKEGIYHCPFGKIKVSLIEKPKAQSPTTFQISADTLTLPFILRKRKPGDRVYFPGVGHKKLKKLLQEKRISSYLRDQLPVIEKDGQIIGVWNVYLHPDFLVTEKTKKIWLLELET